MNAPLSSSSLPSNSFDLQQIAASLEDKLEIRMNRFKKYLKDMKDSFITPTAPIKAVEEQPVGNKMHKAFPLPGESSHWQYKFPLQVEGVPTARRMEIPLPGVCTAMMKKLPVKESWQLH
nr:hypothetical protein [Tanacetum cinerariifolium]